MTTSRERNLRSRSPDLVRDREEILYEGEMTRVTKVIPADGGSPVIRKESFGADALGRLRHERRILQRLVGVDGVPRLIDAQSQVDSIMMEDPNARAIPGPLPLDNAELMRLALGLTRIVGAVHRRGVVHGDINTNSILLAGNDRTPLLVDFHLGSLLSDERLPTSRTREIVGSLPYVAPERTGRTGRPVDQRSDLSALGATLYDLATGRPPFGRGDPLRLVHDHLARVPTAPADLNRRIPRGLSDIVMRLLEKDPDSRYQSAEGLAYDLVMVRDTLDAGPGPSLVLGTRDFPQQLPSPSPIVDRSAELETLGAQFTAAMHGPDRGILIVGDEGVGKGALVEQLRPTVIGNDGWMVTGRSDQYRQDSRSDAVWQALRALGRSLVTESEEDLAAHRKNLRNALGLNAGLIANILPEFGLLLKVTPDPAASQDPMAERRLQQSSVDLIRTIVSTGRPLVLVLDDLQWAGPTALGVIDALLTDHSMCGLLVVGTYCDAEVTPTHPLATMLSRWRSLHPAPREIRLTDLSAQDLITFLQELLRLPRTDAAELARAIWVRSHGNPYDTVELINALRRDGALVQQEGGWCWDAEGLRRHIGHGDVEDLLATRLDALAPRSVGLLDVLACLGDAAEVTLLADASGEPLPRVEQLLAAPLADGLVVREDTAEPSVRFRHGRVRQVVSGRLTPAQRTDIHRTVARRLAPVGQFATVAAEQYLASIDTIHEPDEIRRVVDLLRRACREVRPVNPATAERCLSSAIGLLRKVQTPADTDLILALQTEEHSVLNLLGRHNDVDRVFSAIQRVNPDPQQLADAVCVQVSSLCDRGRDAEGVELGL
ncbi:MAG: ATP-binding region, ATPase domain protein, partial [Mycobacterium sp.]|nr:ATP-binding region, ATPase domain protein [Mycobacterium sp.]